MSAQARKITPVRGNTMEKNRIKTKLVPFILEHVRRDEDGLWIEPFLGTGAVAFNLAPKRKVPGREGTNILRIPTSRYGNRISSLRS